MTEKTVRTLTDGLILRRGRAEDADALVAFNREIHAEDEWDAKGLEDWTLDLLSGDMPTFQPGDFTIVEDPAAGEIVSCCCTISQTWAYEGLSFKVGRPELVGVRPAYRRRGLIREQIEVLHDWSAERGELVQAITGIPHYYRQFGYEMTLTLGGQRAGYAPHVPTLKEHESEPFTFRPAAEGDIPFIMAVYQRGSQRQMIASVWDEALWRYELTGKRPYNLNRRMLYVIEAAHQQPAGLIALPPLKWGASSALTFYELAPGYAWSAVTPSVIRFLWQKGEELGKAQGRPQETFAFALGEAHPAYQAAESLLPRVSKPYTWYVRVPDLVQFLTHIKPVLEQRLESSPFAHRTGALTLNFYKDGLAFDFNDGKIDSIQSLDPHNSDDRKTLGDWDAQFPPLSFLHLVFGYRTVAELEFAFSDCGIKKPETAHLIDSLFPKKPSDIWPIT